jgi:hypothetical protein
LTLAGDISAVLHGLAGSGSSEAMKKPMPQQKAKTAKQYQRVLAGFMSPIIARNHFTDISKMVDFDTQRPGRIRAIWRFQAIRCDKVGVHPYTHDEAAKPRGRVTAYLDRVSPSRKRPGAFEKTMTKEEREYLAAFLGTIVGLIIAALIFCAVSKRLFRALDTDGRAHRPSDFQQRR